MNAPPPPHPSVSVIISCYREDRFELLLSDMPEAAKTPPAAAGALQEVAAPVGISGRLSQPGEVDRYLVNPGQALAYKCGQLEILRLRDEAKRRLGDRFDIRAFHDAVLRNGAVALPVLRQQVELYIAAAEAAN